MSFCTAINCMDGRTQLPVISYMQRRFQCVFVDMITEPGPNRILAEQSEAAPMKTLDQRIRISLDKHESRAIAIVGHEDCGGNPIAKEPQLTQLATARAYLQETYPEAEAIALWVDLNGNVEEL